MHEFKIGDRVKINEEGHRIYGDGWNNPRGKVGTVVALIGQWGDDLIEVQWSDDFSNDYELGTLDLAKPKMLENE